MLGEPLTAEEVCIFYQISLKSPTIFLQIFIESVLLRLRSSWLKQMWTKTENWTMMSFLECCFENLPLTIKTCINKLNEVLHSPDKYIFHVISRALKYLSSVFVLFVFWSICLANAGGSESIQISTLTMCCHHFTNANAQDNAIYDWNEVFIHIHSLYQFKMFSWGLNHGHHNLQTTETIVVEKGLVS